MTAHNGNTEQDERGLLPYPVIIAATKGDPEDQAAFLFPLPISILPFCSLTKKATQDNGDAA